MSNATAKPLSCHSTFLTQIFFQASFHFTLCKVSPSPVSSVMWFCMKVTTMCSVSQRHTSNSRNHKKALRHVLSIYNTQMGEMHLHSTLPLQASAITTTTCITQAKHRMPVTTTIHDQTCIPPFSQCQVFRKPYNKDTKRTIKSTLYKTSIKYQKKHQISVFQEKEIKHDSKLALGDMFCKTT